MKKALITGALGQDGSYLTEHLLKLGYRVYGMIRKPPYSNHWAINWMMSKAWGDRVSYIYGDMRDNMSLKNAIQKSWPDEIYNLAGQVFVPLSWDEADTSFDVNTGGLARILKIVEQVKKDTKVYQASTSEMFGNHDGACTVETEMQPRSPYGVSKLAAHRLVALYRERGLFVVGGILFNHESPRRGTEMVTRKIAMAVANWSVGGEDVLSLGNVDSRRDWGFAAEYVEAMHAMMQQPDAQDYVVGTGVSHSVREFLAEACLAAGVDKAFSEKHLRIDGQLKRQQEIFDLRADTTKIEKQTGWRTRLGFRDLVRMMVEAEQLNVKEAADSLLTETCNTGASFSNWA
jgi:GDPmannose 4,6-dehydratase